MRTKIDSQGHVHLKVAVCKFLALHPSDRDKTAYQLATVLLSLPKAKTQVKKGAKGKALLVESNNSHLFFEIP